MFYVSVVLSSFTVKGLRALDLRRTLGLADNSVLRLIHDCFSQDVIVSEEFARKHFHEESIREHLYIDFTQLQKGELSEEDGILSLKLTDARVVELYSLDSSSAKIG